MIGSLFRWKNSENLAYFPLAEDFSNTRQVEKRKFWMLLSYTIQPMAFSILAGTPQPLTKQNISHRALSGHTKAFNGRFVRYLLSRKFNYEQSWIILVFFLQNWNQKVKFKKQIQKAPHQNPGSSSFIQFQFCAKMKIWNNFSRNSLQKKISSSLKEFHKINL